MPGSAVMFYKVWQASKTNTMCFKSSPVTRLKCWQLMFLQTSETFTFVPVTACSPQWHLYKMCHITFTLHVYYLTFLSEGGGGGGGVAVAVKAASDRGLRLHLNSCSRKITGYFQGDLGTIFSLVCDDKNRYFWIKVSGCDSDNIKRYFKPKHDLL